MEVNKAAVPADDGWEDEVEEQPPDRCPACGVNRLGTYLWGLISDLFQEELIAQLSRDEVRIVGCIIDDQTPRWFCRDCDADILEDGRLAPTEVRWEITYESLAALEESQAWKNWPAVDAHGFTALYAYGPDGKMGYWGMVWDTAQDMRSTLCQNMGGGVPIEVIDKLVSLSARIAPKQD